MAIDIDSARRKHERQLGCEIAVMEIQGQLKFTVVDQELNGAIFSVACRPSMAEESLRVLHEAIYKARGKEVFRQQNGMCALCGNPMCGTQGTEIDHKLSRGAHGRDDRMGNLRVCHSICHRQRHGVKVGLSKGESN